MTSIPARKAPAASYELRVSGRRRTRQLREIGMIIGEEKLIRRRSTMLVKLQGR